MLAHWYFFWEESDWSPPAPPAALLGVGKLQKLQRLQGFGKLVFAVALYDIIGRILET